MSGIAASLDGDGSCRSEAVVWARCWPAGVGLVLYQRGDTPSLQRASAVTGPT
jgi:hypothetical protein